MELRQLDDDQEGARGESRGHRMMEEVASAKKELQIREREDSVVMMSLHQGARDLVGMVVKQAEQRLSKVLQMQQMQYRTQMERMQNQLIWLTARVGESNGVAAQADERRDTERAHRENRHKDQ